MRWRGVGPMAGVGENGQKVGRLMKNVIQFLTSSLAVVLVATSAHAGTDSKTFKEKVVVEEECRFRDYEWQVDLFYTQFWGDLPGMERGTAFQTGSGGGFGVNYFFARYWGVGYEAAWYSNNGVAEHMPLGLNLFARYPICKWNLAPYMMVGAGGAWDGEAKAYGNVGGGMEYRFTNHFGIFVDSRYFFGGTGNVANLRSGFRFAF